MEEIRKSHYVWNEALRRHEVRDVGTGRYRFEEEEKIAIVSEYVSGKATASQIIEKYHIGSRQVLFNWMDKYVKEQEIVTLSELPLSRFGRRGYGRWSRALSRCPGVLRGSPACWGWGTADTAE